MFAGAIPDFGTARLGWPYCRRETETDAGRAEFCVSLHEPQLARFLPRVLVFENCDQSEFLVVSREFSATLRNRRGKRGRGGSFRVLGGRPDPEEQLVHREFINYAAIGV